MLKIKKSDFNIVKKFLAKHFWGSEQYAVSQNWDKLCETIENLNHDFIYQEITILIKNLAAQQES